MLKFSIIWIVILDNYFFNIDKILDRFMISNSSFFSEMGKFILIDS